MKEDAFFQIVDYKKFPKLVKLWNLWEMNSCMLSVGNCEIPEWHALVDYGKKHKKQVAEFVYDMFNSNIEVNWPQMALVNATLGSPIKTEGYISPRDKGIQSVYKLYCGTHCGKLITPNNITISLCM